MNRLSIKKAQSRYYLAHREEILANKWAYHVVNKEFENMRRKIRYKYIKDIVQNYYTEDPESLFADAR